MLQPPRGTIRWWLRLRSKPRPWSPTFASMLEASAGAPPSKPRSSSSRSRASPSWTRAPADRAGLGRRRAQGSDEPAPGALPRRQLRRRRVQRGRAGRCLLRVLRAGGRRAPPPLAHHGRRARISEPVGRIRPEAVPALLGTRAGGSRTIQWTADPLVRGNVYFNLVKLGASLVAYHADFYGRLQDRLNAGEESDRVVVRWELVSERAMQAADGKTPARLPPASTEASSSASARTVSLRSPRSTAIRCSPGSRVTSSACARSTPTAPAPGAGQCATPSVARSPTGIGRRPPRATAGSS